MPALDVITIGRSSVDLYGQQIGSRLEDIGSFAKSVGGCPANIAIGTARLGLKSALITRVGDEQMGRFIREQLKREGVETNGVRTDDKRLTALVLLAVEAEGVSPMIFVRTDCADMALEEADVDEAFIRSAGAVVITGTHFSKPNTEAAQLKAVRIAKANGARVIFDIDYRPNLWGLAGHAAGFERYVKSQVVTDRIKPVLKDCDLIVGTEEEIKIAAGADTVEEALRGIRAVTPATIVLKRGAMGCIVYDGGPIPDDLEQGIVGQGFPIEVYNVLGAGDAFMSGFLRGWLKDEPLQTCATWANACGAFAVSRLLCAPEYPSWDELTRFLEQGSPHRALRKDETLNHIHRSTTRRRQWPKVMALAIDHRSQLEAVAGDASDRIPRFKALAAEAAKRVANGRDGFGMLLDDKYGRDALFATATTGLWIARPLEEPGSRPLAFEFSGDVGHRLVEWPVDHAAKVLCFYRPDDPHAMKAAQIERLLSAQDAANGVGRDLLIEVIASKHGSVDDSTAAAALTQLYDAGLMPDWWKLEAQTPAGWDAIDAVIAERDPYCRGVLVLGLDAPQAELSAALRVARDAKSVRGFAVGRTIFGDAAKAWFAGTMTDEEAVADMAARFGALVAVWEAK